MKRAAFLRELAQKGCLLHPHIDGIRLAEAMTVAWATARGAHHELGRRLYFGYTPTMKTALSLPDELFEAAEAVAERLSLNRSQLYARAIAEFVAKWSADEVRESYDRAYGTAESADETRFRRSAARRTLQASEW